MIEITRIKNLLEEFKKENIPFGVGMMGLIAFNLSMLNEEIKKLRMETEDASIEYRPEV